MLLSGAVRPGRMHDQTALRTEGAAEQFRTRPAIKARVDSGYQGLAEEFPTRSAHRRRSLADEACDGNRYAWQEARRRQSSARICVEHTNAELRRWAPCAGSPDGVTPTPRPTSRSPVSSPTDPPSGPPPTDKHRAGPRRRNRLLITYQPNHQAGTHGSHSPPRSSDTGASADFHGSPIGVVHLTADGIHAVRFAWI
ncbi:transposase family protein [Streptomyces sp. NPDC051643]|uniref:transposase family protein n=1 Tax=Streptomyces sp. NPDC051643 TaxID=3365665 RepID=UPI00378DB647